jgi:hypothetical protein
MLNPSLRNLNSDIRCESKIRFRSIREATTAADGYMERIALTNAPMLPYYCKFHSCWHIGHDRTKTGSFARVYETECLQRGFLRKEINSLLEVLDEIDAALATK